MLAKLERTLPIGDYLYEPKWDGFRCLAARDGGEVDLRSRNQRPFARYFPEVVEALLHLADERFVLDGELVTGDFATLLARTHPAASRVQRLARETPATFVAFDVLRIGDDDLVDEPFVLRRARLESLLASPPRGIALTPATPNAHDAERWLDAQDEGIDGVVAKHRDLRYRPGARAMTKVKRERTADCVVGGMRVDERGMSSLLLGLFDDAGDLVHVGVASGFAKAKRVELVHDLRNGVVPITGHPWECGYGTRGAVGRLPGAASRWTPDMQLDWIPLAPVHVAEVAYDHVEHGRFRHPARFRHWRPDRDPGSCRIDQLA